MEMDTHYLIGLMLLLTTLPGSEQQGPLLVIQQCTRLEMHINMIFLTSFKLFIGLRIHNFENQ